jgi:hypothetical protein
MGIPLKFLLLVPFLIWAAYKAVLEACLHYRKSQTTGMIVGKTPATVVPSERATSALVLMGGMLPALFYSQRGKARIAYSFTYETKTFFGSFPVSDTDFTHFALGETLPITFWRDDPKVNRPTNDYASDFLTPVKWAFATCIALAAMTVVYGN